jgi:hypothetical protein
MALPANGNYIYVFVNILEKFIALIAVWMLECFCKKIPSKQKERKEYDTKRKCNQ